MARVQIDLPPVVHFTTELAPRYADINMGNHVANNSYVSLINEAYLRFMDHYGLSSLGTKMIVADLAMIHKSEALYGEQLRIDVAVDNLGDKNCELFYHFTKKETGQDVLIAKTYIVFYDYQLGKSVPVPEEIRSLFSNNT